MKDYFEIITQTGETGTYSFDVELKANADVYRGHFPGNPISPGVCNIRMIAQCASAATGKHLETVSVSRCRFQSLITPDKTPRLRIDMSFGDDPEGTLPIEANILHGETVCVTFKGALAEVK